MRQMILLFVVNFLIFHFQTSAVNPERAFVKGGEMTINNKKVIIGSFEIAKYEITNEQYASFLNDVKIGIEGNFKGFQLINISSEDLQLEYKNGAWTSKSGKGNYPMVMVSYYGAVEFSQWIGGKLPTETEWTYAAKGGDKSKNFIYAGSNNLDDVGWFRGNCEGHSHEVGKKKPNELGIYDMSGNAWEWCFNDSLKSEKDFCVHMGGSWYPGEQPSQIKAHYGNTPTHFSNSVGFRVIFPIDKSIWRFAVIGDAHIGSSDTIAGMIPYLLADSINCLMLLGDNGRGGRGANRAQLEAQLTRLKSILTPLYEKGIGVYPLRGNHENDVRGNLDVWNAVFFGTHQLPQNGPLGEQNLTYSFTNKNALFIALDDYVNIHTVNQRWLNKQLENNTLPHVFVFGHEPAFKVFHFDCLDDSIAARNTFWQSLTKAGVRTYFCGHDHFVDASIVDDGDGDESNDIYQYIVGTGGGWLMSQYSNYNGTNTPYLPKRIFHDKEFGYALVEIRDTDNNTSNVRINWKKRVWNVSTSANEYVSTYNIIQYSLPKP